ncbi:NADH-quinone oxidoreductase subunit NuoE [Georgenia sunbinii]|uniref:NADH-quinone oxidoreductase subunit NuoE n=1 Tax=Georgenia sunbinii TaxID=3117728 RepID=UPI002F26C88D
MSVIGYEPQVEERLRGEAAQIISRYPQARSALLPMLHLVQSQDGYVSASGIALCADVLGITRAEVSAVATFYTQYKRHPNGEYTVGVCTNALCAVMGGDIIFDQVSEHLGVGHDETTDDGKITLERVECNAACDYAPVVVVNWEFFDNQTPGSTIELVDQIRAGRPVAPTRGASSVGTFKEIAHVLAGFEDGRADEGVAAGPATLVGLELAREKGWRAPSGSDRSHDDDGAAPQAGTEAVGHKQSSAERKPATPDDTDPAGKRGPAGEGATAEKGKDA